MLCGSVTNDKNQHSSRELLLLHWSREFTRTSLQQVTGGSLQSAPSLAVETSRWTSSCLDSVPPHKSFSHCGPPDRLIWCWFLLQLQPILDHTVALYSQTLWSLICLLTWLLLTSFSMRQSFLARLPTALYPCRKHCFDRNILSAFQQTFQLHAFMIHFYDLSWNLVFILLKVIQLESENKKKKSGDKKKKKSFNNI